jgi:hypothetical protein
LTSITRGFIAWVCCLFIFFFYFIFFF